MAETRTVEWVIAGGREAAAMAEQRWAAQCVADWVGVALAGTVEPLTAVLARTTVPGEEGAAGVLGRPNRGSAWDVALVNGAAGHALDYDDTHVALRGHPTAPVLPALLALAERERSSGAEVLAALAAGIEAECRVAALVGPDHYAAGFHATGTIGAFGAAAGCAQLLGLHDGGWQHALGLAAAHAAGLKAQFGTMAKPLHAGRAAADGVRSALLAGAGYTAAADGVEAFARACHGGPIDLAVAERRLGAGPAIEQIVVKRHAACHLTHATIDNAAALRRDGLRAEQVRRLTVVAPPGAVEVCSFERPGTGLEAKFSLRATAALALLGDDTGAPATFTDGRVTDPDVVALRDRVAVRPSDPGAPLTWSRLEAETADGRRLAVDSDAGVVEPRLDVREAAVRAKTVALATPLLGGDGAAELADAALGLADADGVEPLLGATRRAPRQEARA